MSSCGQILLLLLLLLLLLVVLVGGKLEAETLSTEITDAVSAQQDLKRGSTNCPCARLENGTITSLLEKNPSYRRDDESADLESLGDGYGSEWCLAFDTGTAPFCDTSPGVYPGNPDWCMQKWCWVDPNNCTERFHKSRYFPNSSLYFSYHTCGTSNSFLIWEGDNTEHSFTDLIGLLERNLVSTKTTQEKAVHRIQSQLSASDRTHVEKECSRLSKCNVCKRCNAAECWGRKVNFEDTIATMSAKNRKETTQLERDLFACHTVELSTSFRKFSDLQYDETRVSFQFYGDHNSGGYVQWPAMADICKKNYDPRFRPWYVSALSGAKDIVMVIDVSETMKDKIELAAEAAKAVVRTLTWVDSFSIITFSHVISSKFPEAYKDTLARATDENLHHAMEWIDQHVTVKREQLDGTNFLASLQKAYTILSQAKDPSCSQAILFVTDGKDNSFQLEQIRPEMDAHPNIVVLAYSLGPKHDETETTQLHKLTCSTKGILHHVDNARDLPDRLAAYYEYFVQLQDTCHISWMKYSGAFTGAEFLTGCTAIFDYGQDNDELRSVLGVTCIDLNLIVDLDTLHSCSSGGRGFADFLHVARQEAADCSRMRPMDDCVLAHLRERANSTCLVKTPQDNKSATNCTTLAPQPTASNCSHLDPLRLKHIELSGCPKPDATAVCKKSRNATGGPCSLIGGGSICTPSQSPSQAPSQAPSQSPSQAPSQSPSQAPSQSPSQIVSRIDTLHVVLIVLLVVVFVFGVLSVGILWRWFAQPDVETQDGLEPEHHRDGDDSRILSTGLPSTIRRLSELQREERRRENATTRTATGENTSLKQRHASFLVPSFFLDPVIGGKHKHKQRHTHTPHAEVN